MKKFLSVITLLLVAFSVYANDIDGTWTAQMPGGEMEITFVFKITDGKLTGVVRSPNGDLDISNTRVDGKQFSFDVAFDGMTIKHDCTLQEDGTISMKATGTPVGDMTMTLKKQN